jgi:heme/copper-type cytochrome/quinol oxidase subunit 3
MAVTELSASAGTGAASGLDLGATGTDEALREIPIGKLGIWWFLASEIMIFGGLIVCYVLFRVANGGWEAEAAHVKWQLGAVNTLVLVSSSLTMILAHLAVEKDDRPAVRNYLGLTVLLGLVFLGIKAFEYSSDFAEGSTPLSGMFWSFYFMMTGLHALHVIAGIAINSALCVMAARGSLWPRAQQRVEYAGLYWHFVDVVWIFLFPLLYLT